MTTPMSLVEIWATCKNILGKWITAPPGKKLLVRLWLSTPGLVIWVSKVVFLKRVSGIHHSVHSYMLKWQSLLIMIIYCEWRVFSILTHPPIAAHIKTSIVGLGPATRGTNSWPTSYSTTTAHVKTSIVGLGPATRGMNSWPTSYSTTTAHVKTSIVGLGPATRGTNSWPTPYSTTTAHIKTSIVGLGPATRGMNSWPTSYSTTTAHIESWVVTSSTTHSPAKLSTWPALCFQMI